MKNKILIVTTNRRNNELLAKFLQENNFDTYSASSYEEIDNMEKIHDYSLALIDISGFDSRIWQRCEMLRSHNIGFLIFSPVRNVSISQNGLKSGASAVLIKPLVMKELLFYVEHYIKEQHDEENIAVDKA